MFNDCPVAFVERITSMSGDLSRDDESLTCIYIVNWEDRYAFVTYMLGGVNLVGAQTTVFQNPQVHPIRPHLYAQKANVSGLGNRGMYPDGTSQFEKCEVTIVFQTRPQDASGQDENGNNVTFITESRQLVGNKITIKEGQFKWPDGNLVNKDDAYITKLECMCEINIEIGYWFTYPDDDVNVMGLYGHINDKPYKPLLTQYPKHTLLFSGHTRRRQITAQGASAWEVSFTFVFNPRGWRKLYRSRNIFDFNNFTPGYYLVKATTPSGAQYLYDEADFDLFRPNSNISAFRAPVFTSPI